MDSYQTDINLYRWAVYFFFGVPFVAWMFLTRNNVLRILAVLSVLICVQETFVSRRYLWLIGIGASNITAYVALMASLRQNEIPSGLRATFGAWGVLLFSAVLGLLIGGVGTTYIQENVSNFQEFYLEGFVWFVIGLAAFRRMKDLHSFLVGLVALGVVMAVAHLFCIVTGYYFPSYPLAMRIRGGDLAILGNGALFINANSMANAAVPMIPLSLMFAMARREPIWVRLMAMAGVALLLASLFLTNSRGGYLVASVLLFLALLWSGRGLGQTILVFAFGVAIAGLAMLGTALLLPDVFAQTIGILRDQGLETPRLQIWLGYLHLIAANPFGVGLDELNVVPLIRVYQLHVELAHNIYLDLATRVGLPGLLAFLVIVGGVVARNWRAMRLTQDPVERRLMAGLFFLVSGFLLGGFFEPIYQNSMKLVQMFWLYCGVSLSMSSRIIAESRSAARSHGPLGSAPESADVFLAGAANRA